MNQQLKEKYIKEFDKKFVFEGEYTKDPRDIEDFISTMIDDILKEKESEMLIKAKKYALSMAPFQKAINIGIDPIMAKTITDFHRERWIEFITSLNQDISPTPSTKKCECICHCRLDFCNTLHPAECKHCKEGEKI